MEAAAPVQAKKPKAAKKPAAKKPSSHPKYMDMAKAAIASLKERSGSSRQAILKYILSHYNVGKDQKVVNTHLKLALKRGALKGVLKHTKGHGASGSFSVAERKSAIKKTTKPKVKKAAKPKAAAPKRSKPKKTTKPKATKKATKKPKAAKKPKSPRKPKAKKGGKSK